ncbi:phage head-tail joining protein [Bradyrhizobium paxllaeri]|uniref:phage head-tail joining protein n=1 Tax=Bradyrhizobium paxllaeri TaxID=190148 RepID=UPI0008108CFB|nr:hypothetical protein [Bradyrhizobium paxllaeri]
MANGDDSNGNGTAFTIDDWHSINAAIVSGARSVHIADRSVTYNSLKEMLEIRDLIAADLGIVGQRQPSIFRVAHNDGRGVAARRPFDIGGE